MNGNLDLNNLILEVFSPEPGERILIMTDIPCEGVSDNGEWSKRRQMADEWRRTFEDLGTERGFDVHPLLRYPATGSGNADLPRMGEMAGRPVSLLEAAADSTILVAMTEYSATAPLIRTFLDRCEDLRVASMPGVTKAMEDTALAADYGEVARKGYVLEERLNRSISARIRFSTGHEVRFDLRYRRAGVDDGHLHRDKKGIRLINLPSGEAFKVPYEGEAEGEPSRTGGMIPVTLDGDLLLLSIKENRIVEVLGDSPLADEKCRYFSEEAARCNIAELGFGTNERAVVRGIDVEDEKALGLHWAYGRSDHIGGTVGVNAFTDPSHVVHKDIVYSRDTPLGVVSAVLEYADGTEEQIIRENAYTLF